MKTQDIGKAKKLFKEIDSIKNSLALLKSNQCDICLFESMGDVTHYNNGKVYTLELSEQYQQELRGVIKNMLIATRERIEVEIEKL